MLMALLMLLTLMGGADGADGDVVLHTFSTSFFLPDPLLTIETKFPPFHSIHTMHTNCTKHCTPHTVHRTTFTHPCLRSIEHGVHYGSASI